jgi:hypothetical protein
MSYGKLTQCSIISCNVSYKRQIDAETLVAILAGKMLPDEWEAHIMTFFNEVPHKYILGVAEENGLTLEQIANIFETLPEAFQHQHFKELIQNAGIMGNAVL